MQLAMRVMRITNPLLYYGGLQIRRDGTESDVTDYCNSN